MYPAPIKAASASVIPNTAYYVQTLASGERIYRDASTGAIYSVQPR